MPNGREVLRDAPYALSISSAIVLSGRDLSNADTNNQDWDSCVRGNPPQRGSTTGERLWRNHDVRRKPSWTSYLPRPYAHGNGKLWTVLPLDGKIVMPPDPDGSISDKFMWWRAMQGALTIEGHRLDAPAAPAVPNVPRGYHDTGFQASSITFPTEGCWQITGQAGDSELTFVVEVHAKK